MERLEPIILVEKCQPPYCKVIYLNQSVRSQIVGLDAGCKINLRKKQSVLFVSC
jgi:hypothetical protein